MFMVFLFFFFFSSRRRHTRFDCDWSSDVCSSDLFPPSCSPFSGKSSWKMNTDSFESGNGSACVSTVSGAATPGTTVPAGTQLVAGAVGVQVGAVVVPVYCTAVQVVTPAVVVQLTAAGTGTPLMPWPQAPGSVAAAE